MDDDLKPWWLTLSEARLRNHLITKLKMPSPTAEGVIVRVKAARNARRKVRIKHTVNGGLWDSVLKPARNEVQILRVLKAQQKAADNERPARWHALCEYEAVVVKTIEKLRNVQREGVHSPAQFVQYLRKEIGRVIPNNGEHWTDYVSTKDRRNINALFDGLPPPIRGKRKIPFERCITLAEYKEQRAKVFTQLLKEQANAEQEYDMANDSFERERLSKLLDQMQEAQYLLDQVPAKRPLPATWRGLLK